MSIIYKVYDINIIECSKQNYTLEVYMDKNELDKLIDNLYLDEIIELDEIPELDLYMDQVIKESAADRLKYIEDKLKIEKGILDGFNRKLILLSSLVNMSNFYRRLAEKVVDDINSSDK